MSKVDEMVDQILTGAGWATDDYCLNFLDELSDEQQLQVMLKLAKLGKLYREDSLTDYKSDDEPKSGRMTVTEVTKMFMKK